MDKIKEVCQIQVGKGFKARVDESGNILIEKEKFVPKDGDITFAISRTGKDVLSIFENSNEGKNNIYCEIYLEDMTYFKGGFTCMISELKGYRLATEEEKNILFDELKKRGLKWNPNIRTLEKIYIPKNGDYMFYITSSNSPVISISKGVKDNKLMSYADFFIDNNSLFNSYGRTTVYTDYYDAMIDIRLATPEEKEKLDKKLEEIGLRFNSTTKVLEKIYQPKEGDFFYCEIGGGQVYSILKDIIDGQVKIYCTSFPKYNDFYTSGNLTSVLSCKNMRLLTEEEKETLLTRIKQEGYVWDAETKTLDAIYIPKVGDVCIFWNLLSENAVIDILERVTSSSFLASKQGFYDKCILYNEELYKKMIEYKP